LDSWLNVDSCVSRWLWRSWVSATIWVAQKLFSLCSFRARRHCQALSCSSCSAASRPVMALFLLDGNCLMLGSTKGSGSVNGRASRLAVSLSWAMASLSAPILNLRRRSLLAQLVKTYAIR
jgi:hypothetical protein